MASTVATVVPLPDAPAASLPSLTHPADQHTAYLFRHAAPYVDPRLCPSETHTHTPRWASPYYMKRLPQETEALEGAFIRCPCGTQVAHSCEHARLALCLARRLPEDIVHCVVAFVAMRGHLVPFVRRFGFGAAQAPVSRRLEKELRREAKGMSARESGPALCMGPAANTVAARARVSHACLCGPKGSPYEGGTFVVQVCVSCGISPALYAPLPHFGWNTNRLATGVHPVRRNHMWLGPTKPCTEGTKFLLRSGR